MVTKPIAADQIIQASGTIQQMAQSGFNNILDVASILFCLYLYILFYRRCKPQIAAMIRQTLEYDDDYAIGHYFIFESMDDSRSFIGRGH